VRRWTYPALAFLTGAAVTTFEFAAPNLFRAWFGQTIFVWANVIGVILGALAVGYSLGGRLADRTTTPLPLMLVLVFAGAYGMAVAVFGPAVSGWLAGPEEYTQASALPAFVVESLAASLLLFGPPLAALGMATPLMVERASRTWHVGRAAGLIFGVGTFGSIAGIYLTTFVFLESFGVRATIAIAAATLLLLGAGGVFLARRRAAAVAALLPLAGVPFGIAPPWAALPPQGGRLVLAIESPYQLVRVVDRPPEPDGTRQRWLAFDEGMGTYHSMMIDEANPWTGAYYDVFARLLQWLGERDASAGPVRICIVGNAAGTMSALLHRHHDPARFRIVGVEIDPEVTRAARETMGLSEADQPSLRVVHADGRTYLAAQPPGSFDAIVLDAYARQVSIPPALATREFFALVRERLASGGMLFVNLGALRPGGPLVRTLADTMQAGFGSPVYRAPLSGLTNVLLVARRDAPVPPPPPSTPLDVDASFGLHVPDPATRRVLTDDWCPVERLTAQDLMDP